MQRNLTHYYNNRKKYMTIRRNIYLFFIVFGLINIFFPFYAYADIFGSETQDLFSEITENVEETNAILQNAFEATQVSPYDIINKCLGAANEAIIIAIRNASISMALVVAEILLLVEFVRKTVNFEWSSKWENVLLFIVKILIIKQVVQNSDVIISHIYAAFNTINEAITDSSMEFLPCDDKETYKISILQTVVEQAKKPWWQFFTDIITGSDPIEYKYEISYDAVRLFYPDAKTPSSTTINGALPNPKDTAFFFPTIESVKLQVYFLILKAIAYMIFVITIGRVFELALYTIFAPLPLATFASDSSSEIAKSFLKNYIAVVLQVSVIAATFIIYIGVRKHILDTYDGGILEIVALLCLGMGVFKSGSWSRKICGLA